jgi:hypothetical protein
VIEAPRDLCVTKYVLGDACCQGGKFSLIAIYPIHLSQLALNHYGYSALQESKMLLAGGPPCWLGDLKWLIDRISGGPS